MGLTNKTIQYKCSPGTNINDAYAVAFADAYQQNCTVSFEHNDRVYTVSPKKIKYWILENWEPSND